MWFWIAVIAALVGGYFWIGAAVVAAFFAVGSLPFWALILVVAALTWYLVAEKEGGWAVVPFVAFLLFTHFVSRFDLLAWGRENLALVGLRLAEYLAIGLVYASFRWLLHLYRKREEYDRHEQAFLRGRNLTTEGLLQSAALRVEFTRKLAVLYSPNMPDCECSYDPARDGIKPRFEPNQLIVYRMFWWWPFSLLGWAFNDLIREAWRVIKRGLRGLMNWLSDFVFGSRGAAVADRSMIEQYRQERRDPQNEERFGGIA